MQDGGGTSSVLMRVCSTEKAHNQYGCRCVVQMSHIISTDESVQYKTTKTAQRMLMAVYIWKNNLLQTISV